MTDAPFTPTLTTGGIGVAGEHLAAMGMAQREARMDRWAGQIAAGVAAAYAGNREDGAAFPAGQVAADAWAVAQYLEVQREKVLTYFHKGE